MRANMLMTSESGKSFKAYVNHGTGAVYIEEPQGGAFQKSFFGISDAFYRGFKKEPLSYDSKPTPTGGPSSYYDFPDGWVTWNDLADYKADKQWKEHSFHLGNIGKAIYRWGEKKGTTKVYDAKKIVYSGLRVLLMLEGKEKVREYLKELTNDSQFSEKEIE